MKVHGMRSKSVTRAGALIAVGLLGAACGRAGPPSSGTVTGRASPCIGPVPQTSQVGFTVAIYEGSHRVSQQRLEGEFAKYRFVVPPGRYELENPPVTKVVVVRPGHTTHAALLTGCS